MLNIGFSFNIWTHVFKNHFSFITSYLAYKNVIVINNTFVFKFILQNKLICLTWTLKIVNKPIVGGHIFLSINKRKCYLNVLLLFMLLSEEITSIANIWSFYKLSNNLIYTTGMTLHSSGNSSSQVPLKENGRFTQCFSPPFHHIFSLVHYELVLRPNNEASLNPCQGF